MTMTEIKCPEHGEKCIVTMPDLQGLARVRCVHDKRCLDARYAPPTCATDGHAPHIRIERIDADGTITLACSRCAQDHVLHPVDRWPEDLHWAWVSL